MGYDRKFGEVTTERGDIPRDEPVFVLRGQDSATPAAVEGYARAIEALGAGNEMVDECCQRAEQIRIWQARHPGRVKTPDTVLGQIVDDPLA